MKGSSRRVAGIAAVLLPLIAGSASAVPNPVTATFQVSATVLKACNVSATALAFGNYTPGAGAIAGTSAINVGCTKGTPYTMSVGTGSTAGGTISQRLMTNGTGSLQYNVYTSSTYTTLLGDGTAGSSKVAGTGSGLASPQITTVYGQVPDVATNQVATPGAYTDTLTVSVAY